MQRRKARESKKEKQEAAQSLLLLSAATETEAGPNSSYEGESSSDPVQDESSMVPSAELVHASTQTDDSLHDIHVTGLKEKINLLEQTVQGLTLKIRPLPFSEQTFTNNDYVKFHTGHLELLHKVLFHMYQKHGVGE